MDPWEKCEPLYDPHFSDQMSGRHLPDSQVREALAEGTKQLENNNEKKYQVRWHRWVLIVFLRKCFIYCKTAFLVGS